MSDWKSVDMEQSDVKENIMSLLPQVSRVLELNSENNTVEHENNAGYDFYFNIHITSLHNEILCYSVWENMRRSVYTEALYSVHDAAGR